MKAHFHIRGAPLVPHGLAIAIHDNMVLWFGAARNIDIAMITEWPEGTVVNMHPAQVEQLKATVGKIEKGIPLDGIRTTPPLNPLRNDARDRGHISCSVCGRAQRTHTDCHHPGCPDGRE